MPVFHAMTLPASSARPRLPFKPWLLMSALLAAFPAAAQTTTPATPAAAADTAGDAGTIIVTARRIGERLQDVPLSIRALTGKDLQERGITSLTDLSQFTPGLSYSPDFGRTGERPVIRGISALRQEAPQPVSVFIDGVYVRDAALGLAIDDAQRIEVIKGPQSALYGRSTYVGAINYITVKPGNDVTGKGVVTFAGQGERSIFGAVTAPLKADELTVRVRVKHYEYGGTYTNEVSGNKIGAERTNAAGMQAYYTPTPNFDATLMVDYSEDRDGLFAATARTVPIQSGGVVTNQNGSSNVANGSTCNGRTINIVGNNPVTGLPDATVAASATTKANGWPCGAATFTGTTVRRNEADFANYTDSGTGANYGNIAGLDRRINRTALTLNYGFADGYAATAQMAATQQTSNLGADQSYNGTRFAPGFGGPASSWLSYDRDQLNYGSAELRLVSPLDRPLTWLVGAFGYHESTQGVSSGVIAQMRDPVTPSMIREIVDPLRPKSATGVNNFAPFGRVQYEVSKDFRLSAEGRFNSEKVKVGGTPLGVAQFSAGTCVKGEVCYINGERTFKDFSPRLTVDYKPTTQMLVYGQFAKGSKSGGFNTTPGLPSSSFAYDGEKIQSLEAGVKARLGAGVLLNVALFRNNVDGLQLSNISTVTSPFTGTTSTTTIVNNVGKARTQGLETEISGRPMQWLNLSANYAYTDAKALQGTEITNGTVYGGNTSVSGFTLPRTPTHSLAASAAVDTEIGSGLRAFGRVDVVYQSRRYAEIQNLIWADPYTRVNLSGGVRGGAWRVTAFVKNAGNDDTSLNGFRYLDPATFRRTAVDFLPRLRQYGLTLSYDL